jgi:phytoene dehydrogenase-like protein
MRDFDTIVIGSGAAGLTAAVALARQGQSVCVFEQHYLPGGWCHSFTLEGYRFSPGVHYIGEMEEGKRFRRVYEGLGLMDDLTFLELNPDGYDHIIVAGERFDIPKGKEKFAERLKQRFPREAKGIDAYLDVTSKITYELDNLGEPKSFLDYIKVPFRAPNLLRWGLRSAQTLLDAHVSDPRLQAILVGQSGDHGLPPSLAPAAVHASVLAHYFDGGWYPKGGAYTIPRAFIRELRRRGGEIHVKTEVSRILVENGKAIGVRLADGTEVRANHIVCNADPGITYGKLLSPEHVSPRVRKHLRKTKWSVSALSLFLAVDMDVKAAGMDSGNFWWYAHDDVDAIYKNGMRAWGPDEEIPGMFLTCTTLKDPTKIKKGHHTLESFAFIDKGSFKQWASSKFGERPDSYAELKKVLMDKMLKGVGRIIPGLDKHVVFADLGTPLTNEHYVAATNGNLYGTEKSRWQVGPFAWQTKTDIAELYLCGASTLSHGVLGATMGGLFAAKAIMRTGIEQLLRAEPAPARMVREVHARRAS